MNNNSAIIAVIVLVLVVLVGLFAYKQGYFQGAGTKKPVIEVNIPGSSPSSQP